jgi:hypothetical protein
MLALVSSWKVENLDSIAPTTTKWLLEGCSRMAHRTVRCAIGHCPVRHRTLSGAPATSADRWGSTIGALSCGPAWLSGGAPDRPCRLSSVPPARALLLCARRRAFNALQSTVAREVAVASLSHRTLSGDSPDSPVNFSGVDSRSWRVQSCSSLGHRTVR